MHGNFPNSRIEDYCNKIANTYHRELSRQLDLLADHQRRKNIKINKYNRYLREQEANINKILRSPTSVLAKLFERLLSSKGKVDLLPKDTAIRATFQNELTPFAKTFHENPSRYSYAPDSTTIFYLMHNCRPFANGGYAVRAHGIIRGLRSWGYNVIPIARAGYPQDTIEGSSVDQTEIDVEGIKYLFFPDDTAHRYGMTRSRYLELYAEALGPLVEKYKPAAIHAASFSMNGQAALRVREKYGTPVVYEVRGLSLLHDMAREELDGAEEKESLRPSYLPNARRFWEFHEEVETAFAADHLFCITDALSNIYKTLGVPEEKISLLPNATSFSLRADQFAAQEASEEAGGEGAAPAPAEAPKKEHTIGYFGSFQYYEGIETLIGAAEKIARDQPDLKLKVLLIGDGPHTKVTDKLIDASAHKDMFERLPRVPHEEIRAYFDKCSLMIYPRTSHPVTEFISPMKPFEPMAYGIPVISSDVAALADIVRDGETGLTFPAGDADALAGRIVHALGNPAEMQKIIETAETYISEERNWRSVTQPAAALYRELYRALPRPAAKKTGKPKVSEKHYTSIEVLPELANEESIGEKDAARLSYVISKMPADAGRFLDVGPGKGHLLRYLLDSRPGKDIHGCDVTFRYGVRGRAAEATLSTGSVLDLPYEDNSFDVVTCLEVIEHLEQEMTQTALSELRRVCRGTLMITVPFEEGLPISRYHYQRFTAERLLGLSPNGQLEVIRKNKAAGWALLVEKQG